MQVRGDTSRIYALDSTFIFLTCNKAVMVIKEFSVLSNGGHL
jgi:hypothetical protein